MDITQKDRDALRKTQQERAQPFVIGNLVEHRIQDPVRYKSLSRQEQGLDPNVILDPPKIVYESKYIESNLISERINQARKSQVGQQKQVAKMHNDGPHQAFDLPISENEVQANSWLNMDCI